MGCTDNINNSELITCGEDEFPVHTVSLDNFKITKYETTNFHFAEFLNAVNVGVDGTLENINYTVIEDSVLE